MKIWIEDKIGFLEGYSLMEQPERVATEVEKEPTDFGNWRWDGKVLIHDPENAPVVKEEPTEIEQLKQENEELRQRQDMSDEALLELADMILTVADSMKGGA